jgi:hypothetical protein
MTIKPRLVCVGLAGKPQPPLFAETLRRVGGRRPLVVGDRLDTDIEGASNAGYDSLLVMTGVTGPTELVSAQGVTSRLAGLTPSGGHHSGGAEGVRTPDLLERAWAQLDFYRSTLLRT